jgi:hypothetical protein
MATLPHIKITAFGTLGAAGAANEIWSCGLKYAVAPTIAGPPQAPTEADLVAIVTAAQNAWNVYVSTASMLYSSVLLKGLDVTAIAADGNKDPAVDTVTFDYGAGIRGKVNPTSTAPPYQIAMCNTLLGATFTRGPASHGRFYTPLPALDAGGVGMQNGLVALATATTFANAAALLLHSINLATVPSGVTYAALISEGSGTPRSQKVGVVAVDQRPDSQRRRANALDNAPSASAAVD